jgi:hypothetical protein
MNSEYMVNVRTIFKNRRVMEERLSLETVLAHVKNGHVMRVKEWVQSAHPHIPDYTHPFKVSKIKFNKLTGNLEFLELTQDN